MPDAGALRHGLELPMPDAGVSDYLDDKVERLDDKVRQTHVSAESPWVGG